MTDEKQVVTVPGESERIYDEQIAPKLLEVAEICKSMSIPFAAIVEFDPDGHNSAVTVAPMPDNAGAMMRIAAYGMRCQGNVDLLIGALLKDADKHGHNSLYLEILQRNRPVVN